MRLRAPFPMRRPRLILADDNPHLLRVIRGLLEETFEVVASAADGDAALRAVLDLNPDVLVVDQAMPRMTGLEVAARLQRLGHRVRIVLFTVQEDLGCVRRLETRGVHGYVFKRRVATDLVPAIELVLAGGLFVSREVGREDCRLAQA